MSDHLAGCLLKSVYQNPDNGFSSDRALDRDDVRRLVRHGGGGVGGGSMSKLESTMMLQVGTCTERLLHDHKPLLETVRMQACWLAHYGNMEDVIR